MKKCMIFVLAIMIIANVSAQTKIEDQVNYFFAQNKIDMVMKLNNVSYENFSRLQDNFLIIEKDRKVLSLDLNSFKENKEDIAEFSSIYRPNMIAIDLKNLPEISFSNQNEIIKIMQADDGATKVFFGKKADQNESFPSVFIVEHYIPDTIVSDNYRLNGTPRLTAIFRNSPKVEIINNGLYFNPNTFGISARSFFSSDLEKSQFDIMSEDNVKELVGFSDSILISTSFLSFDYFFDRGYKTESWDYSKEEIRGFDVFPEQCSKLGFVFLPGYGYDFIGTSTFTKNNGWILGIAYSEENKFETSLDDMKIFVQKSYENNLTPIVRVDSENLDAKRVADFINRLSNITEGKLEYVQLEDKPNLEGIAPEDYADFVIYIKERIRQDIKVISASLMPGREQIINGKILYDSEKYISSLAEITDFTGSIDYLGGYAYDLNISGLDCITGKDLYSGETICIDDITSYKAELELFKEKTGKSFEVIITEAGYPLTDANLRKTESLLQLFKEDKNVLAALVYSANSWEESPDSAWLKEDKSQSGFMKKIMQDICS